MAGGLFFCQTHQHHQRLPLLHHIRRQLTRNTRPHTLRRMYHPGRDKQHIPRLQPHRCPTFQIIFHHTLQHIDDLFTRMLMRRRRHSRIDIHPHLYSFPPRDAEIMTLEVCPSYPGLLRTGRTIDRHQCHGGQKQISLFHSPKLHAAPPLPNPILSHGQNSSRGRHFSARNGPPNNSFHHAVSIPVPKHQQ
jgi:hypothetical protein